MTANDFIIGDVFEKIETPKINKKANDFPTKWSPKYCIPLLTAGIENQGFARYAKPADCPMIIKNCISVSANGANSGATFYQPEGFAVLQDAYALRVINHNISNAEEGLYLAGALWKAVKSNHDWVNKAGWNHIKTDKIELPVVPSSDPSHVYTPADIDWDYMHDRIAELEHDRIAELDAYLQATGLDDYELTDEDKETLSLSRVSASDKTDDLGDTVEDGKQVRTKMFKIGELFDWENGDVDLKKEHINGKGLLVVSSGLANSGIIGCTDVDAHILPKNTITVDMFGNAFFRDFEYKEVTHARVFTLIPRGFELSTESGLYITSLLRWLSEKFSYADMCSYAKIKDSTIPLPVTSSGDLDYDYMEHYIRAIEKLTIANIVKYKNRVIAETKKIVDGSEASS